MDKSNWINRLYYGDNLNILRDFIPDESVDLIYLDPPFNSNATYNLLFKEKDGKASEAQIEAFDDTWQWDRTAEEIYYELVKDGPDRLSKLIEAMRTFLGSNDMMAYLVMMAVRLVELHRVLKSTGSIYLHCDPTASHFLKMELDAVFGSDNFRREIIWSIETSSGFKSQANNWIRGHDTVLYYCKSKYKFNKQFLPLSPNTIKRYDKTDEDGRKFKIYYDNGNGERRVYLDKSKGRPLTDTWTDIIGFQTVNQGDEYLGYPTQKPEALLERIIEASSNEGDVVLDPFCGCGTAVAVAERLKRRWIGIDITHLAITLMKKRLDDTFGKELSPYKVIGEPEDLSGARELFKIDPYQLQWWALGLVDGKPAGGTKKKGADRGIDGYINFFDEPGKVKRVIISVKGGKVQSPYIRDLKGVVEREDAQIGLLITLEPPTKPMIKEAAEAGFYESPLIGKKYPKIQILTIEELIDGKELEYPKGLRMEMFAKAKRQEKGSGKVENLFEE